MNGQTRIARIAVAAGLVGVLCTGGSGAATAGEACVWKRQPGRALHDKATSVAADTTGGVYLAGYTTPGIGQGAGNTSADVWLRKYGGSGEFLWIQRLSTPRKEFATGVATDTAGNVYLTGRTEGALAGGDSDGSSDIFLARYDGAGTLSWIRQFGTSGWEYPYAVATDAVGDIYIVGDTQGSLGTENHGGDDAFVVKYDGSGRQLWKLQPRTTANEYAVGVATDATGNAFVAGNSRGALGGRSHGGFDAWIIKYDPSGFPLWSNQLGTGGQDFAAGVATDFAGNAYLLGSSESRGGWLAKYSPAGRLLRQRDLSDRERIGGVTIATDTVGNVYVAGATSLSFGGTNQGWSDLWIAKYDRSGLLLWKRQRGTSGYDYANAVTTDLAGNAYVAGDTTGAFVGDNKGLTDAVLLKFSPTD